MSNQVQSRTPGPAAGIVRWLIGLIVRVITVVTLAVVVVGAFGAGVGIGFVTLVVALGIGWFFLVRGH